LRFDSGVKGGNTLLMDAIHAAEVLRTESPAAFATLVRVPATFSKNDLDRPIPAQYEYQRPHIAVAGQGGPVMAVFWSPPFEGVLQVAPEDISPYFAAYDTFRELLDRLAATHLVEFRLHPGEVITFNQRRVLNGRTAFEETSNACRHLQGTYLNIDDFLNRYRTLCTRLGHRSGALLLDHPRASNCSHT